MVLEESINNKWLDCLFKRCSLDVAEKLVHEVADCLSCDSSPKFSHYKENFTNNDEWWPVVENIERLLKNCLKNQWTEDDLKKYCANMTNEQSKLFWRIVTVRKAEIRSAMLDKSCAISNTSLSDFDWKLKFALASDSFSKLSEPLLSLDLFIQKDNKNETLSLELSKSELQNLIVALETANKAMNQFKV